MTRDHQPTTIGLRFWILSVLAGCGLLATAGCSRQRPIVPVAGKVTLNGVPVSGGQVLLAADPSNDPPIKVIPEGTTGPDGSYELSTAGRKGAPVGLYRAVVMGGESPSKKGPSGGVPTVYMLPDKSPLKLDVVANPEPGAYDLKLTK
jgi:hypothetical protein